MDIDDSRPGSRPADCAPQHPEAHPAKVETFAFDNGPAVPASNHNNVGLENPHIQNQQVLSEYGPVCTCGRIDRTILKGRVPE